MRGARLAGLERMGEPRPLPLTPLPIQAAEWVPSPLILLSSSGYPTFCPASCHLCPLALVSVLHLASLKPCLTWEAASEDAQVTLSLG